MRSRSGGTREKITSTYVRLIGNPSYGEIVAQLAAKSTGRKAPANNS
jgi:hypothetical protein